jgi:hypothetical protein
MTIRQKIVDWQIQQRETEKFQNVIIPHAYELTLLCSSAGKAGAAARLEKS